MRNQLVPITKTELALQPDELDKLNALFLQEAGSELTPVITSFQTAELLEKRHAHVLRDIENILFHVSDDFCKNYILSNRETQQTFGIRHDKMYLLTRNGFLMLALGYSGKRAMRLRKAVITRFSEMEEHLKEQASQPVAPSDFAAMARAYADQLERQNHGNMMITSCNPQ